MLTGTSKTISGTASDGTGSGVSPVQVRIARSDGQYWTGSGWSGVPRPGDGATGTTNWTYAWSLDAGQNNGPYTYTITARATDGVGLTGTDATPVTGVKVDNVAPTIISATAVDATTVDVVLSRSASVRLDLSFRLHHRRADRQRRGAARRQRHRPTHDDQLRCRTRATRSSATPATCSTSPATATPRRTPRSRATRRCCITVAQGDDAGRPSTNVYAARGTDRVVDELVLTAAGGTLTLRQIVVRGLDTAATLQTDVTGVRLYRDNGTTAGQWDGSDTQLGTTQTFSGQASGSTATFSGLAFDVPDGTARSIWIVYTIGASAVDGHVVGSR